MAPHKIPVYLFIPMFICAGCNMKTHKDFAFTSPETNFEAGVIHAKLRGKMENLDKNTSVNHAPYEMLLWFSVENVENILGCMVTLNEITLKNLDTNEFVLISESDSTSFREKSDGTFIASVNYKNLDLVYADHKLYFSYSFDESCGMKRALVSVDMKFTKEYSERKVSFWDMLMGA